jgi:hypothetical protein
VAGVAHGERDAVPPLAVLDHSHDVDVRTAGCRLGTHRDQLRTSPGDARRHSRRRRLQLTQQRGRCRSNPSCPSSEIAAVERLIAQQALEWPEIRRLMTVPGANLICAATFIAAVGDRAGS